MNCNCTIIHEVRSCSLCYIVNRDGLAQGAIQRVATRVPIRIYDPGPHAPDYNCRLTLIVM